MAVAKLIGIETEYGITARQRDADPIVTSTLLVNAFASGLAHHIRWNFDDESPGNDARGIRSPGSLAPLVETQLANAVLTNGARFYVDHAHPEYSSPECATPLEAVLYDRAGEEVLRRAMAAAEEAYPEAPGLVVYKNNSDGKGNSYGCHENYLLARQVPFADVIKAVVPHLVTRQVFCGAGKVGFETSVFDDPPMYQLSQRAEFFEEVVGLETTLKRPIVNTRDEPHADSDRFRRLHIIIGDANLSEVATYLKVGSTALLLAMLEDLGGEAPNFELRHPVRAVRTISADPSLRSVIELVDGRQIRAIELQQHLAETAATYVEREGGTALGDPSLARDVVTRWLAVLSGLENDPGTVSHQVDWVAKQRLVEAYADRHSLVLSDPRIRAIDLQYHDLRPERSLAAKLGLEQLVTHDEVHRAVTSPPRSTRAWFRGECLRRFPREVVTANWDSLVFDLGVDPLRRVPMMDPTKGTAEHTEELLASVGSAQELLARLKS